MNTTKAITQPIGPVMKTVYIPAIANATKKMIPPKRKIPENNTHIILIIPVNIGKATKAIAIAAIIICI